MILITKWDNLKLRWKILGTNSTIIILAIIIGLIGFIDIGRLGEYSKKISEHNVGNVLRCYLIKERIENTTMNVTQHIGSVQDNEKVRIQKNIEKQIDLIGTIIDSLSITVIGGKENADSSDHGIRLQHSIVINDKERLSNIFSDLESNWEKYIANINNIIQISQFDRENALYFFNDNGILLYQRLMDLVDEILVYLENDLQESSEISFELIKRARRQLLILMFVIIIISIIISILFSERINRYLQNVTSALEGLASGNLSSRISFKSEDEFGAMGKKLNEMAKHFQDIMTALSESATVLETSSQQVASTAQKMFGSTEIMATMSKSVSEQSISASRRISNISNNTDDLSKNVSLTTTSIEEFTSSLNTIEKMCQEELDIAINADAQSKSSIETMDRLQGATKQISKVINLINDIAYKTNLLALNATIEAASAGDAGKGFAVVANEVKMLANQTAKATFDINENVSTMQQMMTSSVDEIKNISTIINRINSISHAIANAVTEQNSTIGHVVNNMSVARRVASEIAGDVKDTSVSLTTISENIKKLDTNVQTTTIGADNQKKSSDKLDEMVNNLRNIVNNFTV